MSKRHRPAVICASTAPTAQMQSSVSSHFHSPPGAVMTENPDRPAKSVAAVTIGDVPHAPFVFFEHAPVFGFTNGVISITLTTNRNYAGPDGAVVNEQIVVAYLRGNIPAALN